MKTKIKIALVLCLSLMLWVGSAAGDLNETGNEIGNETGNDTDAINDNITKEFFSDAETGEPDDIPPFKGAVGPEHALYELKIAFGNIDETFTYNDSERLGKQVSAARHRIAEARAEMDRDNEEAAGLALGHYKNKTDEIEATLDGSDINATGLMHARQMMLKHMDVLQNLIEQKDPESKSIKGLMNALNNSLGLNEKFNLHIENKVKIKADQTHGKGPQTEMEADNVSPYEKKGSGKDNRNK
jgi:hypothetical protein